jgi:hypothetical protein
LITVAVLLGLLYVSLLIPGIVATALLAAAMFAMVTVEKRWPAFSTRGAELTASES